MKKKKKKKFILKRALLVVFILLIISLIIYIINLLKIKTFYVYNNNYLTDQEVLDILMTKD